MVDSYIGDSVEVFPLGQNVFVQHWAWLGISLLRGGPSFDKYNIQTAILMWFQFFVVEPGRVEQRQFSLLIFYELVASKLLHKRLLCE